MVVALFGDLCNIKTWKLLRFSELSAIKLNCTFLRSGFWASFLHFLSMAILSFSAEGLEEI